jgi:hypothetical protein
MPCLQRDGRRRRVEKKKREREKWPGVGFPGALGFPKHSLPCWLCQGSQCCRNLKLRYRILRQFSRKQCFIVLAQTQQTHVQTLSSERLTLYTLANRLQKQKAKPHPNSLHVTLFAILFPQCYVTFLMFFFL